MGTYLRDTTLASGPTRRSEPQCLREQRRLDWLPACVAGAELKNALPLGADRPLVAEDRAIVEKPKVQLIWNCRKSDRPAGPPPRGSLPGLPAEPAGEVALVGQAHRRRDIAHLDSCREQFLRLGEPSLVAQLPQGQAGLLPNETVQVVAVVPASENQLPQGICGVHVPQQAPDGRSPGVSGGEVRSLEPSRQAQQRNEKLQNRDGALPAQSAARPRLEPEQIRKALPHLRELNIGHSIVSRALFTGIGEAVGEMKRRMNA